MTIALLLDLTHPIPRRRARRIIRRFERLVFAAVTKAWADWEELGVAAPVQRGVLGPSARAFDLSDFISARVQRAFTLVRAAQIVMRYKRPIVVLADGLVQVRFKKLTTDLAICAGTTERQRELSFHRGLVTFPGMPFPKLLTIRYVLDSTGMRLLHVTASVTLGSNVLYWFRLRSPAKARSETATLSNLPGKPVLRSSTGDSQETGRASVGGA